MKTNDQIKIKFSCSKIAKKEFIC